jgi:TetR/AcrR family transcriptional regulator, regulator of cefoperazone and chloramphenicol sensitivity
MNESQLSTRERILECAGHIFGENGFKGTTIRMIAEAADVNVAAINYHFRGKEGLYAEVIEDIFSTGFERFPALPPDADQTMTAKERLSYFIRGTIHRFLSVQGWGGQAGKGRLIARELLEPTPALDSVVRKYMRPHKDALVEILRDLVGDDVPYEKILLCVVSIFGQCIYYVFATSVVERIAPEYIPLEDNIDLIVDHVFRFSLAGLTKFKMDKEAS